MSEQSDTSESLSESDFSEGLLVTVKSLDYAFPPSEPTGPDTCLLFEQLYHDVPEITSDIIPKIKRSDECKRALDIIYYMIKNEEYTERGLLPSECILIANPAHYSVWIFREKILELTQFSLEMEMEFSRKISYYNIKTFQIWNHRKWLVLRGYNPLCELEYTRLEIMVDSKNYILWTYRQWLVSNYFLDNYEVFNKELSLTTLVLESDPLNNSMWVYRKFLITLYEYNLSCELNFCSNLIIDDVVTDYLTEIIRRIDKDVINYWIENNKDKTELCKLIENIG